MVFRPYLWTIRAFLNYLINVPVNGKNMKRYMCVVCGFIYDEAKGLPEEGLAPGTRWEDIPENWTCPDCGAIKSDFEMIEV
jgi:rubredoxin